MLGDHIHHNYILIAQFITKLGKSSCCKQANDKDTVERCRDLPPLRIGLRVSRHARLRGENVDVNGHVRVVLGELVEA